MRVGLVSLSDRASIQKCRERLAQDTCQQPLYVERWRNRADERTNEVFQVKRHGGILEGSIEKFKLP